MKIEFNKTYISSLNIYTDIHAGLHLNGSIFRKCLVFFEDGTAWLSRRLVDQFIPSDQGEVEFIKNYKKTGQYKFVSDRYLECKFEEIEVKLFGRSMDENSSILLFQAKSTRPDRQWSELYVLEDAIKPGQLLF